MDKLFNSKFLVFRAPDAPVLLDDIAIEVEINLYSQDELSNKIPDNFHAIQRPNQQRPDLVDDRPAWVLRLTELFKH